MNSTCSSTYFLRTKETSACTEAEGFPRVHLSCDLFKPVSFPRTQVSIHRLIFFGIFTTEFKAFPHMLPLSLPNPLRVGNTYFGPESKQEKKMLWSHIYHGGVKVPLLSGNIYVRNGAISVETESFFASRLIWALKMNWGDLKAQCNRKRSRSDGKDTDPTDFTLCNDPMFVAYHLGAMTASIFAFALWNTLSVVISSILQLGEPRQIIQMASLGPQRKSVPCGRNSCVWALSSSHK